jgi:hypothetical protein
MGWCRRGLTADLPRAIEPILNKKKRKKKATLAFEPAEKKFMK